MNKVILYGGKDCHLCQQAEQLLKQQLDADEIIYQDVALDKAMHRRYGLRIPVVQRLDNQAELGWPFDHEQLHRFLS